MEEDFLKVIDTGKLTKLNLSQEVRLSKLEKPMAVQILQAINVGVAKRDINEDGDEVANDDHDEEKKFETRYLDPSLIKEKKKANKDAARLMKLSLTDGLNMMEAIEHERLKMDFFNIGQKLLLKPPIEVRRGVLFLTNANLSYLGAPITTAAPVSTPATTH